MAKAWIIIAALLGASAVALGAFHAHGLKELLEKRGLSETDVTKKMDEADVAVRYHMYHALAIFGVGLLLARRCTWLGNFAALAMFLGVLGFSGGLYLIVFGVAKMHQVLPVGGVLMIVGWVVLGFAALFPICESCAQEDS